jgi:hypothetical protein
MRSGNVQNMRNLAKKLQESSAAEEFKGDIVLLLQLAKDFEDRRDDARMNSLQMAQECSNNRSMQSASRFVTSKAAMCSPSIVQRSSAASFDVSKKMGFSKPDTPPPTAPRRPSMDALQQPDTPAKAPGAPEPASPGILGIFRNLTSSIFGASSAAPDMQ